MSYSIGDGIVSIALAACIVGCLHVIHRSRQKKLDIIHQERMAAMEKGIPLPEFPMDREEERREMDRQTVIPILGMVLLSLALGTMVVLYVILPPASHSLWIVPLPFGFLGAGFIAFHFRKGESGN